MSQCRSRNPSKNYYTPHRNAVSNAFPTYQHVWLQRLALCDSPAGKFTRHSATQKSNQIFTINHLVCDVQQAASNGLGSNFVV